MKKSLIALAVVAASGAAMAQSSVTLYGIADASFGVVKNGSVRQTKIDSGLLNTSRFGFKGTEDLGDGLDALASGGHLGPSEARDHGLRALHRNLDGLHDLVSQVETDDALVLAEHRYLVLAAVGGGTTRARPSRRRCHGHGNAFRIECGPSWRGL